MYLTTLLTGCLCLLCPLATATLPFHVICGLFSVPPFVTPLPLYSFLNIFKWVYREALFSLVTPGHLLSPSLFLDYRHLVEYIFYMRNPCLLTDGILFFRYGIESH